jgi:hypothetical protein
MKCTVVPASWSEEIGVSPADAQTVRLTVAGAYASQVEDLTWFAQAWTV